MEISLKLVIFLYIITCVSVALDITVLRQVVGFIYLSFIPGYLFLRILKLDGIDRLKTVIFSAGLSIAFLMFVGLLLNEVSQAFSFSRPLSTIPLTLTVSMLTLIMFLFGYRKKEKETEHVFFGKANVVTVSKLCVLFVFPVISIVGALHHNTTLLLLMILGIAVLFATSIFSKRLIPRKIFPLAIASASIALLLHTALISKHLMGSDIFPEFYVFKLTEMEGCWHAPGPVMQAGSYSIITNVNSILSTTILPTIYTAMLGIDGEVFFKLFYPFVFSLVPLALYKMFEGQMDKKIALLSVFFFISTPITFYGLEPLSLTRQIIGQLFFILSMYLIVEKKLALGKKRVLLVIFAAALIVAHYSLAYIWLFYIVLLFILSRAHIFLPMEDNVRTRHILTLSMILLLIALTFSWYIYVSDSPLNQMLNSVHRIISFFSRDFLSAEARIQPGLTSLSPTETTSLIGLIHKVLIYVDHFFIGLGIIVLTVKPKKFRLHPGFRLVAIISMSILVLVFVVPNFAPTLNTTRFYATVIPFLAPLLVLGGTFLCGLIWKFVAPHSSKLRKIHLKNLDLHIVTCILIATFLFQVGFINHVTEGYPYSYALDFDKRKLSDDLGILRIFYSGYVPDQEVFSARWLSKNMDETLMVYSDLNSYFHVLPAYALLARKQIDALFKNMTITQSSYIYLGYLNVQKSVISVSGAVFNISEICDFSNIGDKIYSNGHSDIYYAP